MAQVKYVSRSPARLIQDVFYSPPNFSSVGQQDAGVEIALHGSAMAHDVPGFVKSNSPIDTDDGTSRLGQERQ